MTEFIHHARPVSSEILKEKGTLDIEAAMPHVQYFYQSKKRRKENGLLGIRGARGILDLMNRL